MYEAESDSGRFYVRNSVTGARHMRGTWTWQSTSREAAERVAAQLNGASHAEIVEMAQDASPVARIVREATAYRDAILTNPDAYTANEVARARANAQWHAQNTLAAWLRYGD